MKPEICSRCRQEVRWGIRDGVGPTWLHREHVDHAVLFGRPMTVADKAEVDRQRNLPRTNENGDTYTVAEWEREKMSKKKRDALDVEDDVEAEPIPEPEVRSTPIENPKDARVPGGCRTVTNLIAKQGWEIASLTYARGPYLGANGKVLSISDSILLRARSLDTPVRFAVASWRDGKFDTGYLGVDGHWSHANATELKNWIKGINASDLPDAVPAGES